MKWVQWAMAGLVGVCGTLPAVVSAEQVNVRADGSSTVFPITEAVAEEFQKAQQGKITVTVGVSGTGGGMKRFCRGEIDVANASRPITRAEIDACKQKGIRFYELPVAYDAITVVVNPGNDWLREIRVEDLRTMWEPSAQGRITTWKQVNRDWPDVPLRLFGPGAASGTFDYFTEAVNGKARSSRGDYTASEDDNVLVQGVARNKGALGYFGISYYTENTNKLRAVPVVARGSKEAVMPNEDTVLKGTYQPLARPLFIYVNATSIERAEVRRFVDFYVANVDRLAREVKYVPLPRYDFVRELLDKHHLGTAFRSDGEIGITLPDLIARERRI